ncbi:MAG: hypothetical protein ACREDR_17755, partial [Blastocatellia bacterium]
YAESEQVSQQDSGAFAKPEGRNQGERLLSSTAGRTLLAAALATVLLLADACGWRLVETSRLKMELGQVRSLAATVTQRQEQVEQGLSDERQRNQKLSQQVEDERLARHQIENQLAALAKSMPQQVPSGSMISAALVAGIPRANQSAARINLPQHAIILRLVLELEDEGHQVYSAELHTAEGALSWSSGQLKPRRTRFGRSLVVLVPTSSLMRRGDYLVSVSALSTDGQHHTVATYLFSID